MIIIIDFRSFFVCNFKISLLASLGQVRMLQAHSRPLMSGSGKERVSLLVGIKDGTLQKYTAEVRSAGAFGFSVCVTRICVEKY